MPAFRASPAISKSVTGRESIQELLRRAHSLKGMASTMGYRPMERLAHAMEDRLESLRDLIEIDDETERRLRELGYVE